MAHIKYIFTTGIITLAVLASLNGQEYNPSLQVPTFYIADLDLDGRQDTVRYDPRKFELVFVLSGKDYVPEPYPGQELYIDPGINDGRELRVFDGGFTIDFRHMRAWSGERYRYENNGRFILDRFRYEHIRFGYMEYDDDSRKFTGKWWYRDSQGEIIELPAAELIPDRPFYWGELPHMEDRGLGLFEDYQSVYEPDLTDLIIVAGPAAGEGDNHETLYYFDSEGYIVPYGTIYCNYMPMKPGDKLRVTTGTHFYVEPGDGSWHAVRGITDIQPAP